MPTSLQANVGGGNYQSQFSYGPDHQRWRQIGTYSNGTESTHYVGGLLEKVTSTYTGLTYWRHYVPTPSGLTAIVSRNSNNTTWTTYALSDHLGSSDALLDGASGEFKVRESFEAFGARRGSNWSTSTPPDWAGIADTTRRGFTFHEMLDNINLIHMNGRVYDPTAGRFLSVDPIIGDTWDAQSVNPYSYVGNRPLSFVDPSGMCVERPGDLVCTGQSFAEGNVAKGVVDLVVDIFAWTGIFGGHKLPPPPAKSWPGTSAQNGVNICDPGMSSPSCGGSFLSLGPSMGIGVFGTAASNADPNSGSASPTIRADQIVYQIVRIAVPGYALLENGNAELQRGNYILGSLYYVFAVGEVGVAVGTFGGSAIFTTAAKSIVLRGAESTVDVAAGAAKWTLGSGKSATKWADQMAKRGWNEKQIGEALNTTGIPARNAVNPNNPATRHIHPETGQSIVIDNKTNEIIHVGGKNFDYSDWDLLP
ncbi:MAG: RHS repeat-associated core domain-containing protein [Steroidobacteraceae bacterium]